MRKLTKVIVKWEDTSSVVGWHSMDTIKSQKCASCESIGYLIHKAKDRVVLSGMVGDNEYNSIQYIPRGCVKEIKKIE